VHFASRAASQDEACRLWDMLPLLRFAIRQSADGTGEVRFAVHVRNDDGVGTPLVRLAFRRPFASLEVFQHYYPQQ
jgi:hypothetical protein